MELGGADYIRTTTTTAPVFNPSSQDAGMKWFFFLQKWTNGASTVTWSLTPPIVCRKAMKLFAALVRAL